MQTRKDFVKVIMDEVKDDDIVVTSPGLISREVFQYKDRNLNFYVQGSMGATIPIAIGMALNTDRKVYVITGDGDTLMGLDSLVLANSLGPEVSNLRICILDNGSYESTGGQPTISCWVDFQSLYNCDVFDLVQKCDIPPRISISHKEITKRFREAIECQKK